MISGNVQRLGIGREATALLRDGADIRYVQEMPNHLSQDLIDVTVMDLAGGITRVSEANNAKAIWIGSLFI